MQLETYQAFINGAFCDSTSGETFETFNPYTGKAWFNIARCDEKDVKLAVTAARNAFDNGPWSKMTATQRGAILRRFGDLIARDADMLAQIEVRDNGKLYAEMKTQLRYLPEWFYYFGGLADKIEGAVLPIDKPDMFAFTRSEPVGVVVAISPWNSSLLLTIWKLAPALAAGCTVIIKPSEHTSVSTIAFMKLAQEADFPPGVINVVTGFGAEVCAPLTAASGVNKIAFTGSAKLRDPMDEATQVGPVTTKAQNQRVLDYIDIARAEGGIASWVEALPMWRVQMRVGSFSQQCFWHS